MDTAWTADSQSVTVSYDVGDAMPNGPLSVHLYRSADDRLDASDEPIGSSPVPATPGHHDVTIPVTGGLPPNPGHPYVLASAEAPDIRPGGADATASFRTYTLGVVTHGGIQDKNWKNGPAWELVMAKSLLAEGYDAVIPFNWVDKSTTPGAAAEQGRRLSRLILRAASRFPADAPVDLHLIGHSEGAVVNSVAARLLEHSLPANLAAGYVVMTMLDPHAANADVPGQQYSVAGGPLGRIAKGVIDAYQSRADDPPVTVPAMVDDAQVFYQHTPVSRRNPGGRLYNLWGQVPVRGTAHYFNLTLNGVTHSGKTGVYSWYQRNIVPLLGDGESRVLQSVLTGTVAATATGVVTTHTPAYSGRAYPGSTVRVYVGPVSKPSVLALVGRTAADAAGNWTLTTRALADSRYRVVATAMPPRMPASQRLAMVPTTPLGVLIVSATPRIGVDGGGPWSNRSGLLGAGSAFVS
ncbi:MAG: hypothetical protein ABS79_02270 [Planctomycetes bacterium SCN 63-9]|jgi:hypothetical protein|nr:MAG: hypothetical protein ABS79_02270 [Planctomycetes bacterium SCN 63-9]